MGCASSAPSEEELLEREKRIMAERMKNFEEKQKLQQQPALNQRNVPDPIITKTEKQHQASSTPTKTPPIAAASHTPQLGAGTPVLPSTPALPPAHSPFVPSSELAPMDAADEDLIDDNRRRKYTINDDDPKNNEVRKSKNLHDMGQFMGKTKDFARRASFNPPQPSAASPFTPEMIKQMEEGAAKVLEEERLKKEKETENVEKDMKAALDTLDPLLEESGRLTMVEKDGESRMTFVASGNDNNNNNSNNISSDHQHEVKEEVTEEERAKYVVRDANDRKSKNISDLGQFMGKTKDFARRASINAPPPS